MANNTSTTTETCSSGFLGAVERLGNKIPHLSIFSSVSGSSP